MLCKIVEKFKGDSLNETKYLVKFEDVETTQFYFYEVSSSDFKQVKINDLAVIKIDFNFAIIIDVVKGGCL